MFSGGHLTITVGSLDAAAAFYTGQLGLKLTHRLGNRWVAVDAGPSFWSERRAGLTLGLQPHAAGDPAPGTRGAVSFGFETDATLEPLIAQLTSRAVGFTSELIEFEGGRCIALADAEGNPTYLWQVTDDMLGKLANGAPSGPADAAPQITGGHGIVFVSNMDRAVRFYTEVLGLPLTNRHEDKIATVEAGDRLVIALHPTSPMYPPPGTPGAVRLALHVDEPIDRVLSRLARRGARVAGSDHSRERSSIVEDMDGNPIEIVEAKVVGRQEQEAAVARA